MIQRVFSQRLLAIFLILFGIQQAFGACCSTGSPLPLPIPGLDAHGIAFSPNGTCLAIADTLSNTVNIYNVNPNICGIESLTPVQISILAPLSVAFSADGNCLAITSGTTVAIYTMTDCTPSPNATATINLGLGAVPNAVSFSPNGCLAVSNFTTGDINIFSFVNCTPSSTPTDTIVTLKLASINSLAFSPDGNCLAAGFNTSNILNVYGFDGCTHNGTVSLLELLLPPVALAFSPNGLCLAVAGTTQTSFFKINSCNSIDTTSLSLDVTAAIRGLAFSPNGNCLAISLGNSSIEFFSVNPPTVTITSNPSPAIIDAGQSVLFTAKASGVKPLSYQWNRNGAPISGANKTTLTTSTAGEYTVTVTDANGCSATSNAITVTVNSSLSVTITPPSLNIAPGETLKFTANPSGGTTPYSYQWQKNGQNLPGQTNANLIINNAQTSDSGTYTVVVTDATGSTASADATATVNPALTVTVTPPVLNISVGDTINLQANASDGVPPYTFQWQRNGQDLPGQTDANLIINNAQTSDSGTYTVIATDSDGNTANAQSLVNVNPFALTIEPSVETIIQGQTITFTAIVSNPESVTFQWFHNGTILPGQTNSILNIPNAQPSDAGNYSVQALRNGLTATATAIANVISGQTLAVNVVPSRVETCLGCSFTLDAKVTGGVPPYAFQWQGPNNFSANTQFIGIINATLNNAGIYQVTVTDSIGNVATNTATVVISPSSLISQAIRAKYCSMN